MYFLKINEVKKIMRIIGRNNSDIKKKYIEFLNSFQKVEHSYSKIPKLDFSNKNFGLGLQRANVLNSSITNIESIFFNKKDSNIISKDYLEGLDTINKVHKTLLYDINSVVNTVAFYKVSNLGGGSVTCFIGLIWLSPQQNWDKYTYVENIIHETIHQLLFLEDMVYKIFPNPDYFCDEDALAISSILKIRRPFDKSFHSACVAAGIAFYYNELGFTDKVKNIISNLKITVNELILANKKMNKKGITMLSPRGIKILNFLNRMVINNDPKILNECL